MYKTVLYIKGAYKTAISFKFPKIYSESEKNKFIKYTLKFY